MEKVDSTPPKRSLEEVLGPDSRPVRKEECLGDPILVRTQARGRVRLSEGRIGAEPCIRPMYRRAKAIGSVEADGETQRLMAYFG